MDDFKSNHFINPETNSQIKRKIKHTDLLDNKVGGSTREACDEVNDKEDIFVRGKPCQDFIAGSLVRYVMLQLTRHG